MSNGTIFGTKYGKEWSLLNTRVADYVKYFIKEEKLNKKWAKDVVEDIEKNNTKSISANIKCFLKDYITPEDEALNPKELLTKYSEEIDSLSKFEKETNVFGFYNAWWVFGEVAKEMDYDIFMAEAENVGYKRTKRGENPMPNELYDIEFAPNTINTKQILEGYDLEIKIFKEQLEAVNKKIDGKETEALKKKAEKHNADIETLNTKIENTKTEKAKVIEIFKKYYENDKLKAEFAERTDTELISHFKNGVLSHYKSDDIVLRTSELLTILDNIRKEVVWE